VAVNSDKPGRWKADIARSVDLYNDWFMKFAPKEEAVKMAQLRSNYGTKVRFVLFLCGYFDSGYLGYEAAEGIDWVWEHRIDDLAKFGL